MFVSMMKRSDVIVDRDRDSCSREIVIVKRITMIVIVIVIVYGVTDIERALEPTGWEVSQNDRFETADKFENHGGRE